MLEQKRFDQIDILKGLAIISVIFLHSLTAAQRDYIGGPFYIYQAVPVFMVLAGFNGISSYERRGCKTLREVYNWTFLSSKLHRLLLPYLFVCIIELGLLVGFLHMTASQVVTIFSTGGYGPGSYFLPIILQTTFILPIIYLLIKRNATVALILVFMIDIGFEIYAYHSGMSNPIYRLISLRYIFPVALGAWLAIRKSQSNLLLWIGALLSVAYIYLVHYASLIPPFQPDWQSQNIPSFFYPFLLVVLALKLLPRTIHPRLQKVTVIGKASYHIFFVQMVYFVTLSGMANRHFGVIPAIFFNIVVCLFSGVVFYSFEKLFRVKILNKSGGIKKVI